MNRQYREHIDREPHAEDSGPQAGDGSGYDDLCDRLEAEARASENRERGLGFGRGLGVDPKAGREHLPTWTKEEWTEYQNKMIAAREYREMHIRPEMGE